MYGPSAPYFGSSKRTMFVLSVLFAWRGSSQPLTQLATLGTWFISSCQWLPTVESLLSSAYIVQLSCNCFKFDMQWTPVALLFARANAGNSIAARIAIMAMTTSNSMRVKPEDAPVEALEAKWRHERE